MEIAGFRKVSDATSLRVRIFGSLELVAGVQQNLFLGVRVGSTDYDVAQYNYEEAKPTRRQINGERLLTGIPRGVYTIAPRFRSATASGVRAYPGDDYLSYSVEEVG